MTHGQWKAVYSSVCGTSHVTAGTPCQDFCTVSVRNNAEGGLLIFACADGAGSAKYSDEGSRIACDRLTNLILETVESTSDVSAITKTEVLNWFELIRSDIEERAAALQVPSRELATTLLGGVVSADNACFMQIGDGSMVIRRGDSYECVFWPQSGEYANTTNFLTDKEFAKSVEVTLVDEVIDEFVAFTDGLERLILNFSEQRVHEPFILPMLASIRRSSDADPFFEPLRSFLNSSRVNERTDDDKTLILATRLHDANYVL
jgi:hypothetical protein